MTSVRTLYLGLNPDTGAEIDREPFTVVAAGDLEFLESLHGNVFDAFFSLSYRAAKRESFGAASLLLSIWKMTAPFSSAVVRRYARFLSWVIAKQIKIVENVDSNSLSKLGIELIVSNGWSLLPEEIVLQPRFGCINVHPSLLPQYKGALPTLWSLKNNDSGSGVTFHLLAAGADTGHILAQYPFAISGTDSSLDLEAKIDAVVLRNLYSVLLRYVRGELTPSPQVGEGSSTGKYQSYRRIRWTDEFARDIQNKIILYPYLEPGISAYGVLGGRKTPILGASAVPVGSDRLAPGTYRIRGLHLYIGTREGILRSRLFQDVGIGDSLRFILRKNYAFD